MHKHIISIATQKYNAQSIQLTKNKQKKHYTAGKGGHNHRKAYSRGGQTAAHEPHAAL